MEKLFVSKFQHKLIKNFIGPDEPRGLTANVNIIDKTAYVAGGQRGVQFTIDTELKGSFEIIAERKVDKDQFLLIVQKNSTLDPNDIKKYFDEADSMPKIFELSCSSDPYDVAAAIIGLSKCVGMTISYRNFSKIPTGEYSFKASSGKTSVMLKNDQLSILLAGLKKTDLGGKHA